MEEPKGPITSGVLGLERILAESAAFRRRVGAASAAQAIEHIFLFDYENDPVALHAARPFAAIWPADRLDLETVAGGARNYLSPGGQLVLVLTDADRFVADRRASGLDFAGFVDEFLLDLMAMAGFDDYLSITGVNMLWGISRPAPKDEAASGAYWHTAFLVTWG